MAVSKARFLGHRIDVAGVHTTNEVQEILDATEPTGKLELQGFLGLLAFYDNFLKTRATVAAYLYKLIGKNTAWIWSESHLVAFRNLEAAVSRQRGFRILFRRRLWRFGTL